MIGLYEDGCVVRLLAEDGEMGSGKADYTVYFYAQFSCPLKEYGIWSADIPDNWTRRLGDIGKPEYIDRVIPCRDVS